MLALKSTAAALLASLVLVVTPTFLVQDAGAGKPDDVAQLLPEETLGFLELVKAPRLLNDWKEYVGSVTTPKGKEKACAFIEDWFTKTLEIVPEKLLKDLREGLPSIQRMAVALTGTPDPELPWIFIATSTDPAFFKKIVEQDLAVFAGEEKVHQGVKVLAIRKLGDLKIDHPVYAASAGGRLIVTTRWASMTDALDRAAGRGTGGDLRKNRLYSQFAAAASDDPVLRAFSRWDWEAFMDAERSYSPRRAARMGMDQADAAFGVRKLTGAIVEATFKPGRVESTLKIPIESPCRLYDAFRQSPGPKDLLAHLPKRTVLYGHQNLKSGKEVWAEVETFIRRFQDTERKANPDRHSKDFVDEMNEESMKELGFVPRDLAATVGNEILLGMADPGEAGGGMEHMFFGMFRAADPDALKVLMEAVSKKVGQLKKVVEDKLTLYLPEGGERPCFGVLDTVAAIGLSEAVVREALTSKGDASGAVKRLPKEAAAASGVLGVNPAALFDMILKLSGVEKPEALEHLKPDDWSTVLSRTEKDHAAITAIDAGYGAALETGIAGFPLVILGVSRAVIGTMEIAVEADPAAPMPGPAAPAREPAPLPAEELAKRTGELIPQLRSDELTVREQASVDLKALGRQAIPLLIAAYKSEKDAEARTRLTRLLIEHKAWDALPELLDHKADAFFDEFRAAIETLDEENPWGGFAMWHGPEDSDSSGIEPFVMQGFLGQFKNADALANPAGVKRIAERLKKSDLGPAKRAQFAALLAFHDCGSAFEIVLEMRDAATDPASRAYLTAALGWSDQAKAREAVYRALEAKDLATRRGAFMAAERSRDPEVVPRLLDRTKDEAFETRWNAGYTLGVVTSGKMDLNAFLPDAEFEAQVKKARTWWEENKGGFKTRASQPR